jgi:hypothetical protein
MAAKISISDSGSGYALLKTSQRLAFARIGFPFFREWLRR